MDIKHKVLNGKILFFLQIFVYIGYVTEMTIFPTISIKNNYEKIDAS